MPLPIVILSWRAKVAVGGMPFALASRSCALEVLVLSVVFADIHLLPVPTLFASFNGHFAGGWQVGSSMATDNIDAKIQTAEKKINAVEEDIEAGEVEFRPEDSNEDYKEEVSIPFPVVARP